MDITLNILGNENTYIEFANAFCSSMNQLSLPVKNTTFFTENTLNFPVGDINFYTGGGISKSLFILNKIPLPKNKQNILIFFEEARNIETGKMLRKQFNYVFDLFKFNISKYNDNSIYCPLGWSEQYEYKNNEKNNENIPIFFFGSLTNPRNKKIKQLSPTVKVITSQNIYGNERDTTIKKSKLNLMIKISQCFSSLRFLLIVCKKKIVLSEIHKDYDVFIPNKHFVVYKNNNMKEIIKYWLNNDKERLNFAEAAYNDIKTHYNYTKFLKSAITKIKL